MEGDKKITILTIKNTLKKMDLLRIHIYEHSIRFDSKIEYAIQKYPELSEDVLQINKMWKQNEITEKQVLMLVLHLMGKYNTYLEEYYFKAEDLDENGCYVDEETIEIENMNAPFHSIKGEEMIFFFKYFKEQNSFKKISKKHFEEQIPDETIGEEYVNNYKVKGARFLKAILEEERQISNWYFMMYDNKPIMAYEKLDNNFLNY